MFDTRTTGKKIAALRKEKNLTQMELADEMGVSYQAVSNWERGNSMPDISKLPQLALLLGCSVDEILGKSRETELVEHIIQGTEKEYMKASDADAGTIINVAPVIKPGQTKELVENLMDAGGGQEENDGAEGGQKKRSKVSVKDLIALAPFLEDEHLEELVKQADVSKGVGELVGLAPFLSEEALDEIIDRVMEQGNLEGCTGLYPFLGHKTLKKMAEYLMKNSGGDKMKSIMPFL